jgi:hypothetical protein
MAVVAGLPRVTTAAAMAAPVPSPIHAPNGSTNASRTPIEARMTTRTIAMIVVLVRMSSSFRQAVPSVIDGESAAMGRTAHGVSVHRPIDGRLNSSRVRSGVELFNRRCG